MTTIEINFYLNKNRMLYVIIFLGCFMLALGAGVITYLAALKLDTKKPIVETSYEEDFAAATWTITVLLIIVATLATILVFKFLL